MHNLAQVFGKRVSKLETCASLLSYPNNSAGFTNFPSTPATLEVFDNTDAGTVHTQSQRLNGASNNQVGVGKIFKVYPGDKVKAEAYMKYWMPTSTTSNLSGFAAALTSAFGVNAASTGENLKIYNALNNFGGFVANSSGHGSSPDVNDPKAFVTILLFDKNYNFLDAAWDQLDDSYRQNTSNANKDPFDYVVKEVTVKEDGFAYVYISNESPTLVDVYFDDVVFTRTPSNIIQSNEYYPFGLATANSWTRQGSTGNQFLYNEGSELNALTGIYDLEYRNYDPQLARMHQVDPMADKYGSMTPYNYAFNDPVYWNDPSGADPWDDIEASRAFDANRNYYNSYGIYGDDDMYGSGMGGSMFGREGVGVNFGPSLYNDAAMVLSGAMSIEEYAARHGTSYEWHPSEMKMAYYFPAINPLEGGIFSISTGVWLFTGGALNGKSSIEENLSDKVGGELSYSITVGPQGTIVPTPYGLQLAPYVRGAYGIEINLGSLVLAEGKASTHDGVNLLETTAADKVFKQGAGFAANGFSVDFERTIKPNGKNSWAFNGSMFAGLLSIEINNKGEFIFGSLPKTKAALVLGAEIKLKTIYFSTQLWEPNK